MGQSSIFEFMYDTYKITKPVRIIELFAGYGSQHLALSYLGVDVKGHKIVEWAVPSIQAYKDLHYTDVEVDHTIGLTVDEIINALVEYGISANYNEPMTKAQIKRKGSQWCRNVYNNIKNTNNLVNISNVKATDLEITETDKYDYIMTYSFPCQDLSLAGKRLGMDEDSETRSSLLWQVQRLLDELNDLNQLPQVLLMENVPQVMAQDNLQNMEKWDAFLSKLGYKSYIKNLIATDYGIPQIRNRTFMISILGEYSYTFPKPMPLKLKLSDMLEDEVDESYFLSDKQIKRITESTFTQAAKRIHESDGIMSTILARDYKDPKCVVLPNETATTRDGQRPTDNFIIVPEKTKQGYAEATDGDGVYINRPHQKRGVVQKGKIQTLKTTVDDIGVVVNDTRSQKEILADDLIEQGVVKGGEVINHSYSSSRLNRDRNPIETTDGIMPTLTTRPDTLGVVVREEYQGYSKSDKFMQGKDRFTKNKELADTILTTPKEGVVVKNEINGSESLRIRKLTPREVFRLMGVKDRDYDKIADFSNSSLYKLAGNSIVIQVLMGIFGELLGIDYKKKIKESVKEIVWKLEIIGQERLSVY